MAAQYARLPHSLEPKEWQTAGRSRYLAHGPGYTLRGLRSRSLLLEPGLWSAIQSRCLTEPEPKVLIPKMETHELRLTMLGTNPRAELDRSAKCQETAITSLARIARNGAPASRTTRRFHCASVYPAIDLVHYGTQGHLKYDFVVGDACRYGRDPASHGWR